MESSTLNPATPCLYLHCITLSLSLKRTLHVQRSDDSPPRTISFIRHTRESPRRDVGVVGVRLVKSEHFGEMGALVAPHHKAAFKEHLDQVRVLEIAVVIRLVVVGRESPADVVSLGKVALLEGVCDDADASRLGDAKHLGRHLLAHRKRNFVEEIGAGHDVERGVCERKILSLGLHKFRPCDFAPCHCLGELCKVLEVFVGLLEIKGRQV